MENLYTPGCMRTYSGIYLNILDPHAGNFLIEDIAHALSMTPRFAGHMPIWYSVADHCNRCAVIAEGRGADIFQALMHDASEAYLGDMVSPVKRVLPGYVALEDRFMTLIASHFGFGWPLKEETKQIDRIALEIEWKIMIGENYPIQQYNPKQAKSMFLNLFHAYKPQTGY